MTFRRNVSKGVATEEGFDPEEDDGWFDTIFSDSIPTLKLATDWFESMVGGEFDLYGLDANCVKLNDMVFELLEDPDDGYRSYLGATRIADSEFIQRLIFFKTPLAKIRISQVHIRHDDPINSYEDFQGYHFVDVSDGHVWCKIGTGNFSDYYPYFVCSWHPKKNPALTYN